MLHSGDKKDSFFRTFFMSYLILLFIASVFSVALLIRYLSAVSDSIETATRSDLQRLTADVEAKLTSIENIPVELYVDPLVLANSYEEKLSLQKRYNWIEIIKKLKNYQVSNNIIESVFIYFPARGAVVSGKALYDYGEWCACTWNGAAFSSEEFLSEYLLSSPAAGKYAVLESGTISGSRMGYFKAYPAATNDRPAFVVGVFFNDRLLFSSAMQRISAILTDSRGRRLYWSSAAEDGEDTEKLREALQSPEDYVRTGNAVSLKQRSDLLNAEFFYHLPDSGRLPKAYANVLWCILLAMTLLSGLGIAYLFARRNARPLGHIAELLSVKPSRQGGIYRHIEQRIQDMLDEQQAFSHVFEEQKLQIQDHLLEQYLCGFFSPQGDQPLFSACGLEFSCRDFILILFGREGLGRPQREMIMSAAAGECGSWRGFYSDRAYVCLFNFTADTVNKAFYDGLQERLSALHGQLCGDTGTQLLMVHSYVCSCVQDLPQAYRDSLNLLEQKNFTRPPSDVHGLCSREQVITSEYDRTLQLEPYIRLLQAGNLEECRAFVAAFIGKLRDSSFALPLIQLKVLALYNVTMTHLREQYPALYDSLFTEQRSLGVSLLSPANLHELEIGYEQLFGRMRQGSAEELEDAGDMVSGFMRLVQQQYADSSLSVADLCERLGISHSYLSRVLKRRLNMSALEYLQKYRMRKAVERIQQEPQLTVSQIAHQVGFYEDAAFSRVFKKYLGVTPGRYRDEMADKMKDTAI